MSAPGHELTWKFKILAELTEFYSDDEAQQWYYTPQSRLGGRRPSELVRDGDQAKVLEVIAQLRDGAFV